MITSQQIRLVKESWQSIAAMDTHNTGEVFYKCLFEIAPEVKPMFNRESMYGGRSHDEGCKRK